jgi:hypothetical protein
MPKSHNLKSVQYFCSLRGSIVTFLVTIAKLQKAAIGLVMSVRLFAQNTSPPNDRIFMKIYI